MIKQLRKEIRKHVTIAVSGAFALIIALTWNDTINKIVDSFVTRLGIPETAYGYQIIISLIVTVICVAGIIVASRYSVKEDIKQEKS